MYPDEDEWLNSGDAIVVDPTGNVVAGPLHRERAILYAECDPAKVALARRTLDVAGHYSRPMCSRSACDGGALPIVFEDEEK